MAPPDDGPWTVGLPPPEPPEIPADPVARWPELRRVGTHVPLREYLAQVWRRREFAITVPLGELRAQNQDTALGQVWHLLNPLMLIAIYFFIFEGILNVSEQGGRRGVPYYLPFLAVGILTYNYTRSAVGSGARMIVKNRKIVQTLNFPRAILPMSAMVAETISHLYALPVMFVMVLLAPGGLFTPDGVRPMWRWLLIVPVLVVHLVFNLGAAMITARLAFHFRDVQQFLPYLLRLGLYASGVLIPLSIIPQESIRRVLEINPIYNIIEMTRQVVLGYPVQLQVWWLGMGWSVATLVFGFWYFRRAEHEYGDV